MFADNKESKDWVVLDKGSDDDAKTQDTKSKSELPIITAAPLIVKCQVCRADIEVILKNSLPNAVVCNACNKYTPLKKAPPKKEYLRCSSCNHLLLAEKRPTGIKCLNADCKKVIRKCQVDCTRWERSPGDSQILPCECELDAKLMEMNMMYSCWIFKGSLFLYVLYRFYIVLNLLFIKKIS